MTSRTENALKRKQSAEEPEAVVSSDDDHSKSKARRVSTDPSESSFASHQTTEESTTANEASATIATPEASMEIIGAMIQDLCHSDNTKINAALDALVNPDFMKDKKKREIFVTAGGCLARVTLMKNCLDKVIGNRLTKLNALAELATLYKTLLVITHLTYWHDESIVGIAALGGVEAIVKVMKTFPECQGFQERACGVLVNLVCKSVTGEKKAIEVGGLQVLLAAVKYHWNSAKVCERVCNALYSIAVGSKENTELLISLGAATAVAKVRTKWADDGKVQTALKSLTQLIVAERSSMFNIVCQDCIGDELLDVE